MNTKRHFVIEGLRRLLVLLCAVVLVPGDTLAYMPPPQPAQASAGDQAPSITADQLDSLVAPIALYPDPLLAQVLAASTYPLEIIQLQQWLGRNSGLKDQALADAAEKQPWDASVQALAGLPEVAKRLADDIQWTTDLGNAFLAQESDVMDAVQRMRLKAQDRGALKSNEQMKVETQVVETRTVVVIQQANPQVVYVPVYNPVVVWGPPFYPFPPIFYPPPAYFRAGVFFSFGVGVAMGYWGRGGWGWGPSWGSRSSITINNNNNFIRNSNIGNGNRGNIGNGNRGNIGSGNGNNRWQHRPEHRGGAPYRDRSTADRFGGTARGDSLANRQSNARQQLGRQGGQVPSNRAGAGVGDRAGAGVGNRAGVGAGGSNRPSGAGAGTAVGNRAGAGTGAGNRTSGAGVNNRAGAGTGVGNRPAGETGRVGNRTVPPSTGSGNRSGFGGGSQGFNGNSARASGNRGSSSAQTRGGGGARGSGGGTRAGGGGRR